MDTGVGDADRLQFPGLYILLQNGLLIYSYEMRRYHNNETDNEELEETRQYYSDNCLIKQIENGKTVYPKDVIINNTDTRY
ncbi:MAG: hypothetical protein K0R59_115 [Sphingobacterium sp.]|jgi:hypothetical protein|nr:hypothetical protein [Sphingobacterium sp.]